MTLGSDAFKNNESLPTKFTCQGDDVNPSLTVSDVPEGTHSLALIMDDPDAPGGTWDHWIVWNIDPRTEAIAERSVPDGAVQGSNSWGRNDYGGPCPPSGTHRYQFSLYALSDVLSLAPGSNKQTLLSAMEGKILDQFTLIGLYQKT